jgi:hypothetical protein
MLRTLPRLLAAFLLCAPLPAHAAVRLLATPPEARGGSVVTFRWSGLPEAAEELELEFQLEGGHWVRLSPELEAEEREYHWTVPAGLAGVTRVRLRFGGRHEEEVGAELTLRLIADAQREPAQGMRSADAWDLDRTPRGPVASAWDVAHPIWSAGASQHAVAVTSASCAPEPARDGTRASIAAASHPARRARVRSFESRRRCPLRN